MTRRDFFFLYVSGLVLSGVDYTKAELVTRVQQVMRTKVTPIDKSELDESTHIHLADIRLLYQGYNLARITIQPT